MKAIFKQILVAGMLMLFVFTTIAQVKHHAPVKTKPLPVSKQLAAFYHLAAQASVTFIFPKGFKEIKAPNGGDFSFDYAMELPGRDFEIWFRIKSEKESWDTYEASQNTASPQLTNPDSLYTATSATQAAAFCGDNKYYSKNIPPQVLARYNANAGKSYLLNLLDLRKTKHYKYALLITLQKDHTGSIMAVCFTNEKGPEFFKNIDKASNCLKFKP